MSTSRVYIGRIPYRAHEKDIERFFKGFGKIRDIMLKTGYCFVEFDNFRDADDAVYERNGRSLCGEKVVVEHARGVPHGEDLRRDMERGIEYPQRGRRDFDRPRQRGEYRLIVENLSSRISWQDLKDMMRGAGEVTFADAHRDRKNEGIVEFASRREMEKALYKYDGMDLNGRKIRLFEAPRRGGTKRSRSKSSLRHSSSSSSGSSKSPSVDAKRKRIASHEDNHEDKNGVANNNSGVADNEDNDKNEENSGINSSPTDQNKEPNHNDDLNDS